MNNSKVAEGPFSTLQAWVVVMPYSITENQNQTSLNQGLKPTERVINDQLTIKPCSRWTVDKNAIF